MKIFVWDFHGVLEKDNELAVKRICEEILEEFGIKKEVSIEFIIETYGKPWGGFFRKLSPESSEETIYEMVEKAVNKSKEVSKKYLKPMDNARFVLEKIKNNGDMNIVLSNSRYDRLMGFIETVGLDDVIDGVVGIGRALEGKDFDIVKHKRDRILELKEKFKPEECIVTGDNEWDVGAGNMAGSTTFLFSPKNKDMESKADFVIDDLRDILKVYGD